MRSEKDRTMNTPFPVFCIAVDGREKTFKARALTMAQAAAWCPLATEFGQAVQKAMTLNPQARYEVLAGLQEHGIDVLKACPTIEQADRVDWESLTYEQVMGAIDDIFEVSDPFARAQRSQMEALEKQIGTVEKMKQAGVDISQFMPSPDASGSPFPT